MHTHTHTHTQCGQFINFLYYVTSCLKRSLHAFQMKHISYYNYWVELSVVVEVFFRDPMELTHRMVVTCSRRLYIIIIFLFESGWLFLYEALLICVAFFSKLLFKFNDPPPSFFFYVVMVTGDTCLPIGFLWLW